MRTPGDGHYDGAASFAPPAQFPARGAFDLAHIFYINVRNATERREHMEHQLRNSSIPYTRFEAVTPSTIDPSLVAQPWCTGTAPDAGKISARACRASHLQLYRQILKDDPNGTRPYLILEDDVVLQQGWYEELSARLQTVPADAAAVLAASWGHADCKDRVGSGVYSATKPDYSQAHDDGKFIFWYAGTGALVVWPFTLPVILQTIEQQELACHIDVSLLSAGSMRTYALFPPVVPLNLTLPVSREHDAGT